MVSQYPHIIEFTFTNTTLPDTRSFDSKGNLIFEESVIEPVILKGRAELNNSGKFTFLPDGSKYTWSFVVYLPLSSFPENVIGCDINAKDSKGNPIAQGSVKSFSKGQLNARLWV